MKEKVLALAKGKFEYEKPALMVSVDQLDIQVQAGQITTERFYVENASGTRLKGFGSVEDEGIEFLPVFEGEKNEVSIQVDATRLEPGAVKKGKLSLVTDCGEKQIPYCVTVEEPTLADEKGTVSDYQTFCQRVIANGEHGASLFHSPDFKKSFLRNDLAAQILYDELTKHDTKLQSVEEFLVAMGKKDAMSFLVKHVASGQTRKVAYALQGDDLTDEFQIQVNTWGNMKIRVKSTADFIVPEIHSVWTEQFLGSKMTIRVQILADKVPAGKRKGKLVLESPYERREIQITAFNAVGHQKRRERLQEKKVYAALCREVLAYVEGKTAKDEFAPKWNQCYQYFEGKGEDWTQHIEELRTYLQQKDAESGAVYRENSPFTYSSWIRQCNEDPELLVSLDGMNLAAIAYGLKHDLISKELTISAAVLAGQIAKFSPLVYYVLCACYEKYPSDDILRSICSLLIRNGKREHRFFKWFEKGVECKLRITDLFESYMYAMDQNTTFRLPEVVISYFQYENHLNDSCKAFLYAYLVKKKNEMKREYEDYQSQMQAFALQQLKHHRLNESLAILYEDWLQEDTIQGDVAKHLPYIMFNQKLTCDNPFIRQVVVVHDEMKEKITYSLDHGKAMIQLFTPNYQLFFVDEQGNYLAGTVAYTLQKMLHLDHFAKNCWEQSSDHVHLLAHLAAISMRGIRMERVQTTVLHQIMKMNCFRPEVNGRLLLRLFDFYREKQENGLLLEVLDSLDCRYVKHDRLGEVAAQYIYHGMYEEAEKILREYGLPKMDEKALVMLLTAGIEKHMDEFVPEYVKWTYHLYQEHVYEENLLHYLLQYYMGPTKTLAGIYKKCEEHSENPILDSSKERLLGQVLFASASLQGYEPLYLEYYAHGNNRMLVKAFLASYAYEYIVDRIELTEEIFVRIEKEAFYVQEPVMVLATLKRYGKEGHFAKKQQEFIERHVEELAKDGVILCFMKDFIGKVSIPYEVENSICVQYFCGRSDRIFLHIKNTDREDDVLPMREVFPGIFTRQLILFRDEQRTCYIEEEQTGFCTEDMEVCGARCGHEPGFFTEVDQMIEAKQKGNVENYEHLRKRYETQRFMAEKLFTIR
ncbi:MAG: DUF5717 family protein [Eubacterium sp.]|nr:DUF5717 family protein [Eubacterium sp.]